MSVTASPFLEMIRGEIRLRGYSIRTEKSYLFWIKQFILFNAKQHPASMGGDEVKVFLTWLAVKRGVTVNTIRKWLRYFRTTSIKGSRYKRSGKRSCGQVLIKSGALAMRSGISSQPTYCRRAAISAIFRS